MVRNLKMIHLLFFAALTIWGASPAYAQNLEDNVKSGLIYNFLKYTTWPEQQSPYNETLHVCLLGGDPFNGALYPIDGQTAQQRRIHIHNVQPSEYASTYCHAVFVHHDLAAYIDPILESFNNPSLLTISDIKNFAQSGGMVEMGLNTQSKVELLINKSAVENSNVQIEDRLLKLAEVIE